MTSNRAKQWDRLTSRPRTKTLIRFTRHIFLERTGCWIWTSVVDRGGYAKFGNGGQRAHRLAYAWVFGPIPEGLVLDHKCRRIRCVNPDHLRPMTAVENVMIGDTFVAKNKAKTACAHGHAYDDLNTIFIKRATGGFRQRQCRICQQGNDRRYKERMRATANTI